jgi:transcriptional regulator with XRE-family HTH domain
LEILSTGEKIKRARIYKGYTLKDISGDKISVSKMSCIENDKIEAEDDILDYIGEKLNIDKDYLRQNIKEQILQNIKLLEDNNAADNYEQEIMYNLSFADKYKYYNLCFTLFHMLFNYYLDRREVEKVQSLTSNYYESCQKAYNDENYLNYCMDMARFLFVTREFQQAATYYNNIRKNAKEKGKLNILAKATYNEAACFIMLHNNDRAYEIAVRLEGLIEYFEGDLRKAEVYHMLAILSLKMNKGDFEHYEAKSYELYKYDSEHKAMAIYNYATAMYDAKFYEFGLEYIKKSLLMYPKNSKAKLVRFMLLCVDELIDNDVLDYSQELCDEALNYAIVLDDVKFIERAYYLKTLILQKMNNLTSAEMYMNLSLDALLKFGTKQEIYQRYMEMGYMYFNLSQVREAVEYLNLAINIEKKM